MDGSLSHSETRMRRVGVWAIACVLSLLSAGRASAGASFSKDIKPLLTKYCAECHGGSKVKAGYSVETFAALTRAGKKGALVVPEKPDESRLVMSLAGNKTKVKPPKKSPQPSDEEIVGI